MWKLLAALGLSAGLAYCQPSYVQESHCQASGGTTVDCSSWSVGNVTNGHLLILFASMTNGAAFSVTSVTKTAGTSTIGTPALIQQVKQSGGGDYSGETWQIPVTGTGTLTLRVTWSGTIGGANTNILELSGQATSSPIDGIGSTSTGISATTGGGCGASSPVNTPTITTATNNDLILSGGANNSSDISGNTGTLRSHQGPVSAFIYSGIQTQVQTTAGAITPKLGAANDACVLFTLGVKPAGGTGYTASPSDTTLSSETVSRSYGTNRSPADAGLSTEAVSRSAVNMRTGADGSLAEATSRVRGVPRPASDTALSAESTSRLLASTRTDSAMTLSSESPSRTRSIPRAMSDSGLSGETPSRILASLRGPSDASVSGESVAKQRNVPASISDTAISSESTAQQISTLRAPSDAGVSNELVARIFSATRGTADGTVSVSVSASKSGGSTGYSANLSVNVTPSVTSARLLGAVRGTADIGFIAAALIGSRSFLRAASDATALHAVLSNGGAQSVDPAHAVKYPALNRQTQYSKHPLPKYENKRDAVVQ